VLVTSPEVLIFLFFMITDPKTTPEGRVARVVFGALVGFLAALLAAPQITEFSTKVAVLGSLVIMCAARYALIRWLPEKGSERDSLEAWWASLFAGRRADGRTTTRTRLAELGLASVTIGVAMVALVAASAPARDVVSSIRPDGTIGSDRDVDTAALPPVEISMEMTRINASLKMSTAQLMAADVLTALEAETEGLRTADRELLATGSALARLDDLESMLEKLDDGETIEVPSYDIESMRIVPVYDPRNAQSGPQFGVEVDGTVTYTPVGGPGTTAGSPGEPQPFERVFALLLSGDRYVLAADYPVER
jgi:hypothetical protein